MLPGHVPLGLTVWKGTQAFGGNVQLVPAKGEQPVVTVSFLSVQTAHERALLSRSLPLFAFNFHFDIISDV